MHSNSRLVITMQIIAFVIPAYNADEHFVRDFYLAVVFTSLQ